jgi:hypothetical protein
MTAEQQLTVEDFEAEGLLDGLDPDDPPARLDLLHQLVARGVGLEELKRAVGQDRLASMRRCRALARSFCVATFSRSGFRCPIPITVSSPIAVAGHLLG